MDDSEWEQARHQVISQPGVELIWADTLLPTVKVRFENFGSFQRIRSLPTADYVEPLRAIGDIPQTADESLGCFNVGEWDEERLYTSEGDVYSVKHSAMGIEDAWLRTSGSGVTIGMIDTGINDAQKQLLPVRYGGRFDTGASAGRWFKFRDAWSGDAEVYPYDHCQHGTETAGVAVAPRDGSGPVGVAWGSNLVATRISDGVVNVSADDAQHGIRNTLTAMETGPRVVSMSWQSLNWWWHVSNEIDHWQTTYPNTLLFVGAAGTSPDDWVDCGLGQLLAYGTLAGSYFWGPFAYIGMGLWLLSGVGCATAGQDNVVFPAEHPNVVAVTCVDYPGLNVSNDCHSGPEVEFTAFRRFPTVHGSGDWVDGIGASSGAAPTVAGQAALIWSEYPYFTRAQLLDRMRWAGWSAGDGMRGYGIVDTHKAVGGMYNAILDGQDEFLTDTEVTETYTLLKYGGDGPYSYYLNGLTTQQATFSFRAPPPGETEKWYLNWKVTDNYDGTIISGTLEVRVTGCDLESHEYACDA